MLFPTERILRDQGYVNGHFSLEYYFISPWIGSKLNVYQSKLIPNRVSKDKTEIVAKFKNYPELTNEQNVTEFENYYENNKNNIRLITISGNKSSIVQNLKFNFFTKQYIFKFTSSSELTKEDAFFLYVLKYQPITEEYDLLPFIQDQSLQYTHINPPKFLNANLSSKWIVSQSYESLINFTESDCNIPLSINNALETIYYDINDTNSFVHFGSYQSRLNSFARKYLDLLSISQSYILNSKASKIKSLLSGLNTFQRHLLLDLNLITTGSENSIKSLVDIDAFNQWYQTKINSASVCDTNNIHALYKLLPEAILYDEDNVDLVQFINFLGDTLDEFWAGIRNLTSVNSLLQVELQNFSFDYLVQILRNYGIAYERGYNIESLNKIFFESSVLSRDNIELNHYNKILLVRLLANMPFLLKSKGSRHCIQQLYNIFGLSQGLLKIHEFVKDSCNASNMVNITKPYYSCSSINTMSFNNTSDAQVALIYCRFPVIPSSNDFLLLNSSTISVADQKILDKPYLFVLEKSASSVNFSYYVENQLSDNSASYFGNNLSYISLINQCAIDNIKFLKQTMSDYSLYAKGTNIIDSQTNISAIFNFNSLYPNQLENLNISSNYNESAIEMETFDTIKYSSIFSLGNTPSKFYTVSVSQSVQLPQLKRTQAIKNYSNVHFGAMYSDYYDSQFIIDYENTIDNLLDNDSGKSYKYRAMQDYKYLYANYFRIFTTSYFKMVDFYEKLDSTFFSILQQFIPYSLNAKYGVILNNNVLTRNKVPVLQPVNANPAIFVSCKPQIPSEIEVNKIQDARKEIQLIPQKLEVTCEGNIEPKNIRPQLKTQVDFAWNSEAIVKTNNFVNISIPEDNYRKMNEVIKMNAIWRINGQGSVQTVKSRYYADTLEKQAWKQGVKSAIGSATTSSVSKQRKMIIDQDKNLTITKIKI